MIIFFYYNKVLYKFMLTDDYFSSGPDEKDLKEPLKEYFDMYSLSWIVLGSMSCYYYLSCIETELGIFSVKSRHEKEANMRDRNNDQF